MASPAEPMLASAIYRSSKARGTSQGQGDRRRLASGCNAIDKALGNGLGYGSVCCINGDAESGAREICEAFLISHLLSSSEASATIIDTAHVFDVRKLHRKIKSQMGNSNDVSQHALAVLERLKIMKAFDFDGLVECLSELRHALKGQAAPDLPWPSPAAFKATIGDSEDEDEMLDEPLPPPRLPPAPRTTALGQPETSSHLLLIDSISQVASPIIKNRHVQGQALLTSLMQNVTHVTKVHGLCTMLINGVTSSTGVRDETPSMFESCTLRPLIGRSFMHMLDTNILVHRMERFSSPRRPLPNVGGDRSDRTETRGQTLVLEVMQDRNGTIVGQWAAFSLDSEDRPVAAT